MSTRPQSRYFWLAAAVVLYVCVAALRARGSSLFAWAALAGLPLALREVWRRTGRPLTRRDAEDVPPVAAIRACAWGIALWLAARVGPAGRPGFDAAANLGAGTACVAALVALARVPGLGGLLAPEGKRPKLGGAIEEMRAILAPPPSASRSLDAAAFAGLLWGIAVAVPATRVLLPADRVLLEPLAVDYATTAAGVGGLLVLLAATLRLRVLRRFELGVADRAKGALALTLTAVAVALPAAYFDVAAPDRVLPLGVLFASGAVLWCVAIPEPTTVSSGLRGVLAVMILGAPTTLATALAARELPQQSGAIVLFGSILSVIVGLIARAVARPLGPEQSRWLTAIDAASQGALQPEPDAAIRSVLAALSKTSATPGARPELWRNDPEEVLSVDVAGYLHVAKAEAPERLYELALGEPERTLRAEVLDHLKVRHPEVRPLLAWFDSRRAFSATLVLDEDGPLGFILLPRGTRTAPMALEEARAVRMLCDRIGALLAVSSALARSRQRELNAVTRADEMDDERERLEQIIFRDGARRSAAAEIAARAVRATSYSPKARMAISELERLGRMNAPITLQAPLGVSALGWAAIAHLESPRSGGPFVCIDGPSGAEHDLERWRDPERSPVELADGGTLVLLDASALPAAVQEEVARSLSRQSAGAPRSRVVPAGLIASLRAPSSELVAAGLLDAGLSRWLGDARVELPALADRAEDLRALILAQLARAGTIVRGEPLGVDPAALRILLEHTWPGNELELEYVLTKAARAMTGGAITAGDLAASGFRPEVDGSLSATPLPVVTRRRARSHAPRRR